LTNSAKNPSRSLSARKTTPTRERQPAAVSPDVKIATAEAPRPSRSSAAADARSQRTDGIVVELSPAQVDRIVRAASEGGSMSVLLSGLEHVRGAIEAQPAQFNDSRLSSSLLAGLMLLASFPTDGSYLGNAQLARMLGMNVSTVHRYLQTLVAVGLVERDPGTRRYRLAQ
jgi:hypothetical protein